MGDAVEVRLARLEKAQEGLMSVIENLTVEMGSDQDEEDNEGPEASPRLSAFVPPVSLAHGESMVLQSYRCSPLLTRLNHINGPKKRRASLWTLWEGKTKD